MSRPGQRNGADRALVRNAADPKQVRRAKQLEEQREAQWQGALLAVLNSFEGRHVLSEILERAGLFVTSFHVNGSQMYFNEGRRNFGLELRAALESASEQLTEQLDREMRARKRSQNAETDAAHTPRAGEGVTDDN